MPTTKSRNAGNYFQFLITKNKNIFVFWNFLVGPMHSKLINLSISKNM